MGSTSATTTNSPAELMIGSFVDCKSSVHGDHLQTSSQKIQEFLSRLEEERLKIDAFKRELPLCMQLLNNAMEAYKQQLDSYQGARRSVLLEEFIPIKKITDADVDDGKLSSTNTAAATTSNMEKSSWMTSAQLWTTASAATTTTTTQHTDSEATVSPFKPALESRERNCGIGAFLPFSKVERSSSSTSNKSNLPAGLSPSSKEVVLLQHQETKNSPDTIKDGVATTEGKSNTRSEVQVPSPATTQSSIHRKARRCWSPDLHERFVNALNMLGGSQLATPKQIRELMKVDGLTNDEVKSHLQKYRLHTRRPNPLLQTAPSGAPQLVVLGGIWVPPEYAATAGATFYGAHPSAATAHYCTTTTANQQYPAQPPHHLHHNHSHQMAAGGLNNRSAFMGYSGIGINGALESDANGSGENLSERMESGEEDGVAGGDGEAGGKEGEEKSLVSVGDDGSNGGSDVTLKF